MDSAIEPGMLLAFDAGDGEIDLVIVVCVEHKKNNAISAFSLSFAQSKASLITIIETFQ